MGVTSGTSGSPILNADGAVVAINMGGTHDELGPTGFAIRSDVLDGLVRMVRLGVLPSVDTFSDPNIGYDNEPDPSVEWIGVSVPNGGGAVLFRDGSTLGDPTFYSVNSKGTKEYVR